MKKTFVAIVTTLLSISLTVAVSQPSAVAEQRHGGQRVDTRAAAEFALQRAELRATKSKVVAATAIESMKANLPAVRLSGYGEVIVNSAVGFRDGALQYISAPLAGANLVNGSNLTVILAANGRLVDYYETVFASMDDNSGRVVIWHRGAIAFDKVATNDGTVADPEEPLQVAFSWSKFNKCLASQGIASWVINALVVACGVACAATAGAACALCISAAALISGSTLALCLGKAQQ